MKFQCLRVKKNGFEILIRSEGKQDFIEETGIADGDTEFSEDEWIEGFGSIDIKLTCSDCGYVDDIDVPIKTCTKQREAERSEAVLTDS